MAPLQMPARVRTALVALVEIASREDCCGRPVTLAEIAGGRQLSQAFLEQLFCKLRRAGLVTSVRGPRGGYRLTRAPDQMAIADIVRAMDSIADDSTEEDPVCQRAHALWQALDRHMNDFLCRVTLQDVVQQQRLLPETDKPQP